MLQQQERFVTPDQLSAADAAPPRAGQGLVRAERPLPTITEWSVVGHDRIVGLLHDGTSRSHGKKIITSPIVRVQFAEGDDMPVAHTQSGSCYALAAAGQGFGPERAEQFVRFKSRVPSSRNVETVDPALRTGLMKLPS